MYPNVLQGTPVLPVVGADELHKSGIAGVHGVAHGISGIGSQSVVSHGLLQDGEPGSGWAVRRGLDPEGLGPTLSRHTIMLLCFYSNVNCIPGSKKSVIGVLQGDVFDLSLAAQICSKASVRYTHVSFYKLIGQPMTKYSFFV